MGKITAELRQYRKAVGIDVPPIEYFLFFEPLDFLQGVDSVADPKNNDCIWHWRKAQAVDFVLGNNDSVAGDGKRLELAWRDTFVADAPLARQSAIKKPETNQRFIIFKSRNAAQIHARKCSLYRCEFHPLA